MSLRINTGQLESGGNDSSQEPDGYTERLRKYIPTEAITFWLTVEGLINASGDDLPVSKVGLLWFVFVIGLVFTVGWTWQKTKKRDDPYPLLYIGIALGAFIVWVFGTGGTFVQSLSFYHPLFGSLLLVIYTAGVSFIIPNES